MHGMNDDAAPDPWDDTNYVIVYLYRYWSPDKGAMEVSTHRATLDAIKAGLGIPISDTGLKVRKSDVDPFGRHRKPTDNKLEH
jgi:hypothetical protein